MQIISWRRNFVLTALLAVCWSLLSAPAMASSFKSYRVTATFDDVRFELTNVIISRGLKVVSNGKVGAMLKRTGAAVGSTRVVYNNAEYFSFCSATLSRAMMEIDPENLGFCPFAVYIYVAADKPDEVVVGYRLHPVTGSAAAKKTFTQINALLDGITKEAVQ